MRQESKNIIINFLNEGFGVKKVKNNLNKWTRAIIVTDGYIRKYSQIYKWQNGLDVNLVAADLVEIIIKVFGCTYEEATEIVIEFIKSCPNVSVQIKKKPPTKPKKKS